MKPKKKVRMRVDKDFSPNGIEVTTYEAGKEYELPEDQADLFLDRGWAEKDKSRKGGKEKKDKK